MISKEEQLHNAKNGVKLAGWVLAITLSIALAMRFYYASFLFLWIFAPAIIFSTIMLVIFTIKIIRLKKTS